ncbi:MAG: SCO family protein [Jatrophihabitantaceae bacterium]
MSVEAGVDGPRPSRRRRVVLFNCAFLLCMLLGIGAVAAVVLRAHSSPPAPSTATAAVLPINIAAPGFQLTGLFGQRVSMADYRGKAVVLAFVDSECTTICPLTTSTLSAATDDLGPNSSRVQLLGIDANPLATSVGDVRAYSAAHDLLYRWNFLTGSVADLSAVWSAYHVYTAVTKTGIDHDPVVIVIDPAGRERAIFHTAMSYASVAVQAAQLAQAIAATLGVATTRSTPPAPTSVILPAANVAMTVVAGSPSTTVELGPDHPHLIVFLASWLTQTSDLKAQISILNEYQRAAQHSRLPSLVAIDLATTEPRAGSLVSTFRTLGIRPQFPVVSDTRGALADGYGVQDAPWYSLAGRKGTWQHDGWLTLPRLLAAVGKTAGAR